MLETPFRYLEPFKREATYADVQTDRRVDGVTEFGGTHAIDDI